MNPTRQDAWDLLNEHTKSDTLIRHALAVEAAMRAYAVRYGEDEERWAVTGLIHDFDFEEHPTLDEHPLVGATMLEEMGWPDDIIQAVKAHGNQLGLPRTTLMAKTLYAVDELSGLIIACALVRPSKSVMDLKAKSVRKKWRDKGFARGVSRTDIEEGIAALGGELNEHIGYVIEALKPVASELGIDGSLAAGL